MKKIKMIPVESSQIKSVGFDGPGETNATYSKTYGTLLIEFLNGSVYEYLNVEISVFNVLVAPTMAASIGKYFATEIKGKYNYVKSYERVADGILEMA